MGAEHAAAAFLARFGREPEGVWSAPGRLTLLGAHTECHDGFVLAMGIDRRTAVAASRRTDGMLNVSSAGYGEALIDLRDLRPGGGVAGWAAYPASALWSLREVVSGVGGADLVIDSDVPVGNRLGSSAAIEGATVLALSDLYDAGRNLLELARIAHRGEVELVGARCGLKDQEVAMLASEGNVMLIDARTRAIEQVPFPLADNELVLLVIDAKAPYRLAEGAYVQREAACGRVAEALGIRNLRDTTIDILESIKDELPDDDFRRARHVVTENERVRRVVGLLKAGDVAGIGRALSESHVSLRDDYEVSVPEVDVAAAAVVAGGALGARMTGAGFGGSVIAVGPERARGAMTRAVTAAFAENDFRPPVVLAVGAAEGATRVVRPPVRTPRR